MRNPFRISASQRATTDEEFVRLFGAGAIDLLQNVGDPWGSVVFMRSAPGGGKTTFLRLLTPRPLGLVNSLASGSSTVKATQEALREVGAIGIHGPELLGTMVEFTSEFRELAAFDRGNALFRELVNSRIVIATMRAVLEWLGRPFPRDLEQISFDWEPESGSTIPATATGSELFDWASQIETDFYGRMDVLGEPQPVKGGHARLDGLKWFANSRISSPLGPVEARRVLLFDELQTLSANQRRSLLDFVTGARAKCGVWIAERLETLTHKDLLSEGALENRDYNGVIQLERQWSDRRGAVYARFVENIAKLRAAKADNFGDRDMFALIADGDDLAVWAPKFEQACVDVETRILAKMGQTPRYDVWLDTARKKHGSVVERAIQWRMTEVLVARDRRNEQPTFDFISLSTEEFDKRQSSGLARAAEHFVRTEIGAPIYFGRDAIADVSSFNVEQYLAVSGELFEEISAKIQFLRDVPMPLSAERQHNIITGIAKARWNDLTRRLPLGRDAKTLLEGICSFCQAQTFRETAPYMPGVTGIGITMQDRETLIDTPDDQIKHLRGLRDVVTSLVAHNLLVPRLDHSNKNKKFVVFYLNRLLCVQFGLPLGYGGWREKKIKDLITWQVHGGKEEEPTFV
ncbi:MULTISPECIES: hypothetical protein [unclassified Mesorhizobium]|uniref:ORC-CDC6 family AAA ATPase n=1 Tax=unclassified Mesorhizobium TaxID=325217 RepID=UPI0003CEC416|nr:MULTISPECIES: hypothetical protein [unclassified Mesorhizobium]ESY52075.1 hypothetical protein X745_20965 [Mesorhizobium sp. LNJC374B00]ESY55983.1 hypothetical protein X744_22405 [Mesorhizobium sp. LNJC372A00]WJI81271.1 hypothetical protein NLY34_00455 [Mesorhizobium sp. C374B]WJI87790.1 hypothetical protein NLY42_02870 [Mesorhizobium sp. C372A]